MLIDLLSALLTAEEADLNLEVVEGEGDHLLPQGDLG